MADNEDKLTAKARVMGVFSIVVLLISFCFSDVMLDVADKEITMMSKVYGEESTEQFLETTDEVYNSIFVSNNAVKSFKTLIFPKTYIDKYYAEEEFIPLYFWRYLEIGIDNFLYSIRFSILRVVSFSAWTVLFSLLMFGAIVSGYYQREIKKQGFEYSSPMRHGLARKGIYALPLILYVLIFIPVSIHPYVIPFVATFTAMFSGWFVSNTIKRL